MYLVSVYFDDNTNKRLKRYIDQVAEKTGNTFMLDHQVPPHMTISQIEARNVEMLIPYMESFQGKVSSGEVQFVSVGMLLPYVLYTTPILNTYLQEMSQLIFDTFSGVEETRISKYYQPMSWLPHVTLGKTLTKEQMQQAVKVMQDGFAPFTAKVVRMGLAKVNPHEDVLEFELK